MVHTATDKQDAQTIVVLDDLHMIQEREDMNTCGQLIEELSGRRDVWLILISRAPIPRWLKSVYVHHIFVMIGKELCLTEEEQELSRCLTSGGCPSGDREGKGAAV